MVGTMLKCPAAIACAILVISSCGVDYSKHSYDRAKSAAKPADGVPSIHVAADAKNKMKLGAPYTAVVSMKSDAPFTVKSMLYEHDGTRVTALDSSSSAAQSKPRSKTAKEKVKHRFAKVALPKLKWKAGTSITLRAEVLPDAASRAIVVEQTFEAMKEERHYSCSEYYSMF
jgi:hypothetical protein